MKNENEKPLVSNKQKERKNTQKGKKRKCGEGEREDETVGTGGGAFPKGGAEAPPSGWHVLGDLKDEKGEPSTELEKKGCGVVT